MQVTTENIKDTQIFADKLLSFLKENSIKDGATVLTLSGPLGAGKTALTKCLCLSLGVSDNVTSPTFVLRSDYATKDSVFSNLIHVDAYRISGEEVRTIGWGDVISSPNALVVVEWPENISSHIPQKHFSVEIMVDSTEHTFTLKNV